MTRSKFAAIYIVFVLSNRFISNEQDRCSLEGVVLCIIRVIFYMHQPLKSQVLLDGELSTEKGSVTSLVKSIRLNSRKLRHRENRAGQ